MARRTRLCTVCKVRPVRARDRCMTCWKYLKRNGIDRPESVRVRYGMRRLQAELEGRIDPMYLSSTLAHPRNAADMLDESARAV